MSVQQPTTDESNTSEGDDVQAENQPDEPESVADEQADDQPNAEPEGTDDTADSDEAEDTNETEDTRDHLPERFEATVENSVLRAMLAAVGCLVDECRIHIEGDKLSIQAVNPGNVATVSLDIHAEGFEQFDAEPGTIGVSLDTLDDMASVANKRDIIHLELDPETRKLEVQANHLTRRISLIDPDSIRAEPDIPDLDLTAEVELLYSQYWDALRGADMVSDHVGFVVEEYEEKFVATAEGETDDVEFELDRDDLESLSAGDAHSLYSLDYLKDIRKALPKKTTLSLILGKDFPLKLKWTDCDGTIDGMFMVAPRIKSD